MFDSALDEEEGRIRKENFDAVAHFLGHHDAESGQLEIGFWAYDFRYIPVEIISAIYDEFMKEADMSRKRAEGAYYTPRLLAETTLHIALEGRYNDAFGWRILDPACGSGIFLVAMFNLLAEQWRRANINSSLEAKAQALLGILQNQIRGIDVNPEACRITAFSLYLALFEKLHPTDVENFKRNISSGPFLPALHWSQSNQIEYPVVIEGDFIKDDLPIKCDFDLIIGNPPWESRGREQIALTFTTQSTKFMNETGVGCFLLPTPILVSRTGTLDANWFRTVSVEKIVQLADFRRFLFEATHSCFILRFSAIQPKLEQIIAYETPKINRFDRRQGIIIVEPDDQKAITLRQVLEAARNNRLQSLWSRKFWGTPRDEGFLRRLDLYPQLSDVVSERSWSDGGVGFMPFYPGISKGRPVPLEPWKLTDKYLENDNQFPQLLVEGNDLISLEEGLRNSIYKRNGKHIPASLSDLRRRSADYMFEPPMVIFSQGFTKFAFSAHRTLFQNSLRSINGPKEDADLLCFLTAVLSSRLIQYYAFHSSSSNSIGRAQVHVYEILAIPFPLPHHDLAPDNAKTIIEDVVSIFKRLGENGLRGTERNNAVRVARKDINILVGKYYSISDAEEMLIDDTLELSRPSIHQSNLDADIPTLAMPSSKDRKVYADTLCLALNRMSRKQGIQASARGMVSERLNLMMVTLVFGNGHSPYQEISGDEALWDNLSRIDKTARRRNGSFSYLRGFSYFEADRLHTLKPATMRNWSRTAALNDADAIFEQLIGKSA
ncbi:hypothetical protein CCAX7_46350 [Capsulimonas corticalis]|uniref:site-specific DNA-methyltransferase (adenine-specific) n=2 Tax=Capsulimonas corticalis TaxID=2219043 RepID=A0A402D557_9BACT|nr:hypothetical protein CCAX7_46350 [Capsulimonas corticalis]